MSCAANPNPDPNPNPNPNRQDMVGDVVRGVLKDLDGDGDGVVSLDDFLEWSRVHNLETLVDDHATAQLDQMKKDEREC